MCISGRELRFPLGGATIPSPTPHLHSQFAVASVPCRQQKTELPLLSHCDPRHVKELYDKLAICESSGRNGVAERVKCKVVPVLS
jgi:hypothetical protein